MQLSRNGILFIEHNEGFRPTVYNDNGKKAIGYGHDLLPGESFPNGITQPEAEELALKDAKYAEKVCQTLFERHPDLTQNQFDALVDFGFNLGVENLEKLLSHGLKEVPVQMPKWCYEEVRGVQVKNPNLEARRLQEVNLWNS